MSESGDAARTAGPVSGTLRRISAAVAGFPGVDLATLNDLAALQVRTDRKYVLESDTAVELVEFLAGRCAALDIDGRRAFRYRTTYFDTPDLTFYRATAHRRPLRYKVRTRTYVDSGLTMLEVKGKDRRNRTEKHRMVLDRGDGHDRDGDRDGDGGADGAPGRAGLLGSMARRFVLAQRPGAPVEDLAPTLTTQFHRTTLVGGNRGGWAGRGGAGTDAAVADFRITIDTDLRFTSPGGDEVRLDHVVLESKSSRRASAVDRWLWSAGSRPEPISKYCTSMAALDPALPANHWHRTLRKYY